MSRIAISEDDLEPGPDTPVVYGRVGGTTHPDVYGPVTAPPQGSRPGDLAVATWVLVTAAVVLAVTFGAGGFFAGRAGQISESDARMELRAERAKLEAQRAADIKDATAATRKAQQRIANARVRQARATAYERGRNAGFADGQQQGRNDIRPPTDDCLRAVDC